MSRIQEQVVVSMSIQPYLSEIAERLWTGHAAIMVGAGFSKNASPSGNVASRFCDWSQLGDMFFEKMHGRKPDSNSNDKYLNVLKLADEVQAAFGRPVLNQIIRSAVPDSEYKPSSLHIQLLELPWVDVFTTNYDTLLERARDQITSIKYDVVVNKEDLVYSEKPRIIKLHGSFPSERPFIITEEDYRRYPKDFAPFVNTVQQSLLENTLCLIGFSGDDPNFLEWIGWIRDNLGASSAPKIFLIGIFNISDAQKKLLEQRNIVVLDFTESINDKSGHYKALQLFFQYLSSRKREDNRLDWPTETADLHIDEKKPALPQLIEFLNCWKVERERFPGWCILPNAKRNDLWNSTKIHINTVQSIGEIPEPYDILWWYELNWRMERSLVPLFEDQTIHLKALLSKYQSYCSNLIARNYDSIPFDLSILDPVGLVEMHSHLSISLLRLFRENGDIEEWNTLHDAIFLNASHYPPTIQAWFHYERVLQAIFNFDIALIAKRLDEWSPNEALPFWEAKRAGLLAEVGSIDHAVDILEVVLIKIRERLNLVPISIDYTLVSHEAYIMVLLNFVKMSQSMARNELGELREPRRQFTERWNALIQYQCDPWNELELFDNYLKQAPSKSDDGVVKKKEFDIGKTREIHHPMYVGRYQRHKKSRIAFSYLRFCEETGLAFKLPGVSFDNNRAKGALIRIQEVSPFWAIVSAARTGNENCIDGVLTRKLLSRAEPQQIDTLLNMFLSAIEEPNNSRNLPSLDLGEHFNLSILNSFSEIVSRLCCNCSWKSKMRVLEYLKIAYANQRRHDQRNIDSLLKRLIDSLSIQERLTILPTLLEFPVLTDLDFVDERKYVNPLLALRISDDDVERIKRPEISQNVIQKYLLHAQSDVIGERKWALFTLMELNRFRYLNTNQQKELSSAIWSKRKDDGLPADTSFYAFAFLKLPSADSVDCIAEMRKYILNSTFPVQSKAEGNGIRTMNGYIPLCTEIAGSAEFIDWTEDEMALLFNRIFEWWDLDKHYLQHEKNGMPYEEVRNEFSSRFSRMVEMLCAFMKYHIDSILANTRLISELQRMLLEFRQFQVPAISLESLSVRIFPKLLDSLIPNIEKSLSSTSIPAISDARLAVSYIATRPQVGISFDIANQAIATLIQKLRWRHRAGIEYVLEALTYITQKTPQIISHNNESSILDVLENYASDNSDDYDDYLMIRKHCAELAYALYCKFDINGKDMPAAIIKWEAICNSSSEFAEIRNVWQKNVSSL